MSNPCQSIDEKRFLPMRYWATKKVIKEEKKKVLKKEEKKNKKSLLEGMAVVEWTQRCALKSVRNMTRARLRADSKFFFLFFFFSYFSNFFKLKIFLINIWIVHINLWLKKRKGSVCFIYLLSKNAFFFAILFNLLTEIMKKLYKIKCFEMWDYFYFFPIKRYF